MKPIAIELFAGLHGWGEGFISEGFEVIGYDIEDMCAALGRERPAGITLVIQDVLTLHGSHFKDATVIVASPPCQAYSYRAMPWSRAKALPPPDNSLFEACFRIQREACDAANRHIPMIVENVKGAQKWVGKAQAHFGSYYLWGAVGQVGNRVVVVNGKLKDRGIRAYRSPKVNGQNWSRYLETGEVSPHWRMAGLKANTHGGQKNQGGSLFKVAHNTVSGVGRNPDGRKIQSSCAPRRWEDRDVKRLREAGGTKQGGDWFGKGEDSSMSRLYGSKSPKRKAASAEIAKIPFPLAQHIAKCFSRSSDARI